MTSDLERAAKTFPDILVGAIVGALSEATKMINERLDLKDIQLIAYGQEDMDFLGSRALDAALRALETPSPEVVEAMAKALFWDRMSRTTGLSQVPNWEAAKTYAKDEWFSQALAAWRAGIAAIIKGGGGVG